MTAWSVAPESVSAILTSAQAEYDVIVGQIFGVSTATPVAGAVPSSSVWDTRVTALAGAAGFDGIVVNALVGLIQDHLGFAQAATDRYGSVLLATFDAAQALVNGDEAMAASVVAAAQSAVDEVGGK